MKVVLFCGGLGTRLRDYSENIPKPMVPIGYRPILWHVMKYYAHFGHKDFILCLGYRSDAIKQYFLKYDECLSNDFELSQGGKNLTLFHSDIQDWKITFAETGAHSNIGQRLASVQKYLNREEYFLATYADGLTDLHLPDLVNFASERNKVATFVSVKPNLSYHVVSSSPEGTVSEIKPMTTSDIRINGGYFVLRHDIFSYMGSGEELVFEPFQRLIRERQLLAYQYDGFFACMDTFKDKMQLDDLYARGDAPWEVWKPVPAGPGSPAPRRKSQPDQALRDQATSRGND
jgi:glucose-1-phosphate cytidylyltransferase